MLSRLVSITSLSVIAFSIIACGSDSESIESSQNEINACPGSCEGGSMRGDGLLTAVDRSHGLRADWSPDVAPLPANYFSGANNQMRGAAAEAFVRMLKAAYETAGLDMYCGSGYRSFNTQCAVFNNEHASRLGCEGANTVSAHAGHSEHQLGTVCDISVAAYLGSGDPFVHAGDAADQWLSAHAHEYGFANSYPNTNAAENDGYIHEPWHYRYIGMAAAAELHSRGRIAVPRFINSLSESERATLEAGGSIGGGEPPPPAPPPPSTGGGEGTPCGSLTLAGYCDRNTIVFCKDGAVKKKDCSTNDHVCNFVSPEHGHDCVPKSPCPDGLDFKGACDGDVLSWCADGALRTLECTARAGNHCKLESEATGYNCLP